MEGKLGSKIHPGSGSVTNNLCDTTPFRPSLPLGVPPFVNDGLGDQFVVVEREHLRKGSERLMKEESMRETYHRLAQPKLVEREGLVEGGVGGVAATDASIVF